MSNSTTFRTRTVRLAVLGNLCGAALTFAYFRFVDPAAIYAETPVKAGEIAYFVLGFALLFAISRSVSARWSAPLAQVGTTPPAGPAGELARRRMLLLPGFVALLNCCVWIIAGLVWGVAWPLVAGNFVLEQSLRQVFGITLVAGPLVAAIIFFGIERIVRGELPRLFSGRELSAVRAPQLRVRARMLAVFLLVGLLPLAVLSMAALTRANALLSADAQAAAAIVHNLNAVVAVLGLGGLLVSVALAALVASSIAEPLRDVQEAMSQVRQGRFDARCAVVANDEIGAVAEGFNNMVQGLRERETIRKTFGKYVSPEVRDEILAGRVTGAGAQRQVTILFSDLRDFTSWVEASPPAEVVADLNAYFTEMDAAIRAHRGLVLQFIGDEIEAVFGAPTDNPRHADDAVAAAREMARRLDAWNATRRADAKPALRHGIGIHTGTVIAGNIGSSERMSYALVGDAVNVASRIQSLNKEFGTRTLVSGAMQARLSSAVGLEALPSVHVKGRSAEVTVFSLD